MVMTCMVVSREVAVLASWLLGLLRVLWLLLVSAAGVVMASMAVSYRWLMVGCCAIGLGRLSVLVVMAVAMVVATPLAVRVVQLPAPVMAVTIVVSMHVIAMVVIPLPLPTPGVTFPKGPSSTCFQTQTRGICGMNQARNKC